MKKIATLNEALTYQLKGLYDAEIALQKAIPECVLHVKSVQLKSTLHKYEESTNDKILKLERAFNYLMTDPKGRRNAVLRRMINDTHEILDLTSSEKLKEVMLASCFQSLNQYKMANYKTSLAISVELQLEIVSDLLHEILVWEKGTSDALSKITAESINLYSSRVNPVL